MKALRASLVPEKFGTLDLEEHFFSGLRLHRRSTFGVMLHFADLYSVVCRFFPHPTKGQVRFNSDDFIILAMVYGSLRNILVAAY